MNFQNLIVASLAFAAFSLAVEATTASATPIKRDGNYYLKTLSSLEAALPSNSREVQMTMAEAKSRVNRLVYLEKNDPKGSEVNAQTKACSLYVEIITAEMQAQASRNSISSNWQKRRTTMEAIENIQERIGETRSGKVSTLAADLEAERTRLAQTSEAMKDQNARLQAEMQKKQDELISEANAREAALKKALDEERAKAEARQNEAKNRLNELQSKLIQVSQDARGIILSMSDILFDVDKASLKGDLKTSLAKVAGILSVYQELNVSVEGHTDNTGSADHNMKLSEQRAQNVLDFLVEQGIESGRLSAKGLGMNVPIADNATKEGRQKNRRVDLVIQDKALQ